MPLVTCVPTWTNHARSMPTSAASARTNRRCSATPSDDGGIHGNDTRRNPGNGSAFSISSSSGATASSGASRSMIDSSRARSTAFCIRSTPIAMTGSPCSGSRPEISVVIVVLVVVPIVVDVVVVVVVVVVLVVVVVVLVVVVVVDRRQDAGLHVVVVAGGDRAGPRQE